jgi:tetratricopeptide (TPR) repeat protein
MSQFQRTGGPVNPDEMMRQADAAHRAGDLRVAERLYRALLSLNPMNAEILFRLGSICEGTGRIQDAIALYKGSASATDSIAAPHAALASILERANRIEDATAAVRNALRIDPRHPQALIVGARLSRRNGSPQQAREMLELCLKRSAGAPPRHLATVHLDLAQTLDEMGQYDDAFERAREGKQIWLQMPEARRYKLENMQGIIDETRSFLGSGCATGWSAPGSDPHGFPPIFFVGFPRSGTTLTERILESHSALASSDETPFLGDMIKSASRMLGATKVEGFLSRLGELTEAQVSELRAAYWKSASARLAGVDLSRKRLVDKMPLNIFSLPIARRVFPDAKLIMAIRDPRDCTLSCFMQMFEPNPSMIHFATPETTARFYASVLDCWFGIRDNLGMAWIESRYEDLVSDTEGSARRLIDFLGLAWEPSVMDFQERAKERVLSTPSYRAVSEPISSKAVARWKRYESKLAPILPILDPYVRRLGYETT